MVSPRVVKTSCFLSAHPGSSGLPAWPPVCLLRKLSALVESLPRLPRTAELFSGSARRMLCSSGRSNILLGSQEQTCQVKACFHFISFFPYVNRTESAGGLAFSPGDSSDSCFLLMLSLWHSEQGCFKGQRNRVGLREKNRFNLTVCPCLPQLPLLSCTVLLFQHHGCEKSRVFAYG